MSVREMKIALWPIDNLIPFEANSKKHPPEQVAQIAQSIARFGFDQPIVVDKHGVIIKGHGRRLGAKHLNLKQVPVLVRDDLTPEQVKAARLADNRVAISDIDPELLRVELGDVDAALLEGIFDAKELDFMGADLGAMNAEAFVSDMGAVVDAQKKDIEERMEGAKGGRVPVAKALGFKDISASSQIIVSKLMARAESFTGLQGAEAFVKWADTQLQLGA